MLPRTLFDDLLADSFRRREIAKGDKSKYPPEGIEDVPDEGGAVVASEAEPETA